MAAAETKGEATAANVRRINRTERMIIATLIKRITTIIIIVTDDTIIEGVVLFSVAANRVKTEIMAAVTEALMIFTNAGIYFVKSLYYMRRHNFQFYLRLDNEYFIL